MNKVNYVAGRELLSADLNAIQAEVEGHLRSQAQMALAGKVSGMEVSGTAAGLQVAPGFGWDSLGRRLRAAAAIDVDVVGFQRPSSGQYRWALVSGSYATANRGSVTDVARVGHPAYVDDSVAVAITAGAEFAAADIGAARGTAAGRPAAPEGSVALGLLVVDHDTAWNTLGDAASRPPASQASPPPQVPQVPSPSSSRWEPGDIRPWPGTVLPAGTADCDGAAVSRANNPRTFAQLGETWGPGDGSTTFNLPNLIGRTLIGAGGAYSLGATGGVERVTLTVSQIPAHRHGQSPHTHGYEDRHTNYSIGRNGVRVGGDQPRAYGGADTSRQTDAGGGGDTDAAGGGTSHPNMQPYAVVRWIIYLG